jgi:putative flippase GtrA
MYPLRRTLLRSSHTALGSNSQCYYTCGMLNLSQSASFHIRWFFNGILILATDTVLLLLFLKLTQSLTIANFLAFPIILYLSYSLTKSVVFRQSERFALLQFLLFIISGFFIRSLNTLLILLWHNMGANVTIAKITSTFLLAPLSILLDRKMTFRA